MIDKNKLPPHLRNAPSKFDYLKKAHEPDPDPNAPVHLGMMNGWGNKKDYPAKYKFCIRKRSKNPHPITQTTIGRCLIEYECAICKIKWTVDSSD
jgi:hypothetical protein